MDREKIDLSIFLEDYLDDARENLLEINHALLALEKDHTQTQRLDEIFRGLHTLKSSSVMLEFTEISGMAHRAEDLLDQIRKGAITLKPEICDLLFEIADFLEILIKERVKKKGDVVTDWSKQQTKLKNKILHVIKEKQANMDPEIKNVTAKKQGSTIERIGTVRVHMNLLDSLFNQMGELIVTKNLVDNLAAQYENKELNAALAKMRNIIMELNENVSSARLVPASEIFQKFPRMVRDLAHEQNKKIDLVLDGSEIEMDKGILDAISEPLIHLLKNAVDHGIESPENRKRHKKKEMGTIKLSAKREENLFLIEVEDDGAGMDIVRLKEQFLKKKLIPSEELESLKTADILDLLYRPGFSGAETVTDVSGRGVGLDVVKNSLLKLGGTVELKTKKGEGTAFTLKLPLTTSIIQTLIVGVGKYIFAVPADVIVETLEIKPHLIKMMQKKQVLIFRRQVIPLVMLNDVLHIPKEEEQASIFGIVVHVKDKIVCLGVDHMVDQKENIIKLFDPIAQQFKGFSGGTILDNGSVALLLNVPSLLN